MSLLSRDEIRGVLLGRGFGPDDLTQEHAESLTLSGYGAIKIKRGDRYPLVVHPRHESAWADLVSIDGVEASPERLAHNSNFVGFPKRVHTGRSPIAYGLDFGFRSTDALERFLAVVTGDLSDKRRLFLDAEARAYLEGFLDSGNPQFVYWHPRYVQTLATVREALDADAPERIVDLVWKALDNAVSHAGQGMVAGETVDALREELTAAVREIAIDGGPQHFDRVLTDLGQWRSQGRLPKVPRLLLARAFAAIHPDRYHTTVDAEKQDRVIPWFAAHTGFVPPDGNWATKAIALTRHLEELDVFGPDRERRNMFPWFVFDQLRDRTGALPFRPGHMSRVGSGEVERQGEKHAVDYRQNVIQDRLVELLRGKHGVAAVASEHPTGTGGRADVLVQRSDGRRELYEIKPAATAREAVRQALGQLLEYAHRRDGLDPCTFHVVSDAEPDALTQEYLDVLDARYGLRVEYIYVDIAGGGMASDAEAAEAATP